MVLIRVFIDQKQTFQDIFNTDLIVIDVPEKNTISCAFHNSCNHIDTQNQKPISINGFQKQILDNINNLHRENQSGKKNREKAMS